MDERDEHISVVPAVERPWDASLIDSILNTPFLCEKPDSEQLRALDSSSDIGSLLQTYRAEVNSALSQLKASRDSLARYRDEVTDALSSAARRVCELESVLALAQKETQHRVQQSEKLVSNCRSSLFAARKSSSAENSAVADALFSMQQDVESLLVLQQHSVGTEAASWFASVSQRQQQFERLQQRAKQKIASLHEQNFQHEDTLSRLRKDAIDLAVRLRSTDSERIRLQDAWKSLWQEKAGLESRCQAAEMQRDASQRDCALAQHRIQASDQQIASLKQELQQQQQLYQQLQQQQPPPQSAAEKARHDMQLRLLQEDCQQRQRQVDTLQQEVQDIRRQWKEAEQGWQREKEVHEAAVLRTVRENTNIKEQEQRAQQSLSEHIESVRDLKQEREKQQGVVHSLRSQVESLEQRAQQLLTVQQQLQSQLLRAESDRHHAEQLVTQHDQSSGDLRKRVEELQSRVTEKDVQCQRIEQQRLQAEERVLALSVDLAQVRRQQSDLDDQRVQLEAEKRSLQSHFQALSQQREREVQRALQQEQELTAQVSEAELLAQQQGHQVAMLGLQVSELQQAREREELQQVQAHEQQERLSREVRQLHSDMQGLQSQLSAVQQELKDERTQHAQSRELHRQALQQCNDWQGSAERGQGELSEVRSKAEMQQRQIKELSSQLTQSREQLFTTQQKLQRRDAQLLQMEGQLCAAAESMQSDLLTLHAQLADLSTGSYSGSYSSGIASIAEEDENNDDR